MRNGLSKSKVLIHRQCPKRLYLQTFRPDLAEESAEMQMVFQSGHRVGDVARTLFPQGRLIGHERNLAEALEETRTALKQEPDRPLFEAAFEHDGVLVRADVLVPFNAGYRLVEVKSSTGIKSQYLADCAVQAWVVRRTGLPLKSIELAHVDNTFVYPGDFRYDGLLKFVDLGDSVETMLGSIPQWISDCRSTLSGPEPDIRPGEQCTDPYPCPFMNHCQPPEPEGGYPVSTLYRKGRIVSELINEGIKDLRDIPSGRLKNTTHERQRRVAVAGKAEIDSEAGKILSNHGYPRYYLDYETVKFAVPVWVGTRPYQMLPFQWSCHVETVNGVVDHYEFLGTGPEAPMRTFAERLIQVLGGAGNGPVFVFRQSFEDGRTRELAEMFPDLAEQLIAICERMVDLLPIAQKHYYHPDMHGSWSIKAILPTIAPELDYANLEHIQDGGMAEQAYREILSPETSAQRRNELISGLREYCKQDTLAMVRLVHFFIESARL